MTKYFVSKRGRILSFVLIAFRLIGSNSDAQILPIRIEGRERLVYEQDELGNRIPDFSHCGYIGADAAIPDVPVRIVVKPADGDDGARIQAAIDAVSRLPIGVDG